MTVDGQNNLLFGAGPGALRTDTQRQICSDIQ